MGPNHSPAWFVHEGVNFRGHSAFAGVDILSYHCHPPDWAPENGFAWQQEFVSRWIASHDQVAKELGKPIYLGEFSTSDEASERDVLFRLVLELVRGAESHAGVLFWQLTLPDVNCCDRALVPGRNDDEV